MRQIFHKRLQKTSINWRPHHTHYYIEVSVYVLILEYFKNRSFEVYPQKKYRLNLTDYLLSHSSITFIHLK